MIKYDFSLYMNTDNSNSLIIRNIKPSSKVLEFGCAHGRMTRYLKNMMGCDVFIVEKDLESGKSAAQFAKKYCIGDDGDINNNIWQQKYAGEKFDFILFADVLEHLYNPEAVLHSTKDFLNENGSIWISIPNVSYNGVLIDLLNDNFQYREIGLLDNTHIRFFTSKSLEAMVSKCGFNIVKKLDPKNILCNSEFKNSYADVPPAVALFLANRKDGEIYQFVWELKLK